LLNPELFGLTWHPPAADPMQRGINFSLRINIAFSNHSIR
jgi:hypothetical protein